MSDSQSPGTGACAVTFWQLHWTVKHAKNRKQSVFYSEKPRTPSYSQSVPHWHSGAGFLHSAALRSLNMRLKPLPSTGYSLWRFLCPNAVFGSFFAFAGGDCNDSRKLESGQLYVVLLTVIAPAWMSWVETTSAVGQRSRPEFGMFEPVALEVLAPER